jgi:hypothetical protein
MLYFGYKGWQNGWQRALVTLVSLFFASYLALRATDTLIEGMNFLTGLDYGGDMYYLFQVILYLAAVGMVVKLFNEKSVVSGEAKNNRQKLAGISIGILSGYFFSIFLLNLGSNWFADQVQSGNLLEFTGSLGLSDYTRSIPVEFINNPYYIYNELVQKQNLILLFLLLFFFHGFLFSFVGRADQVLRPKKK